MNKKELWKDIEGYEGLYQVSNLGRVKSLGRIIVRKNGTKQTIKERILKPRFNGWGYYIVNLSKTGKLKTEKVHRLVAQAFIPNPDNKETVNHKDENKLNNNADNLEWMTLTENICYGTRNERRAKTRGHTVVQLTLEGEYVNSYFAITEAEKQTGINKANIGCVLRDKTYTAGSYCWCYENEYEECFKG